MISARALSSKSPLLPTDGSMPVSARRSVCRMLTFYEPRPDGLHLALDPTGVNRKVESL